MHKFRNLKHNRKFSRLLSTRPEIYGHPGDPIRRQVTNKYYYWKKFSKEDYKEKVSKRLVDGYLDSESDDEEETQGVKEEGQQNEEEAQNEEEEEQKDEDVPKIEHKQPQPKQTYSIVCHYKPAGGVVFGEYRLRDIESDLTIGTLTDYFASNLIKSPLKFDFIYEGRLLTGSETLPDLGFFDTDREIHVNARPASLHDYLVAAGLSKSEAADVVEASGMTTVKEFASLATDSSKRAAVVTKAGLSKVPAYKLGKAISKVAQH